MGSSLLRDMEGNTEFHFGDIVKLKESIGFEWYNDGRGSVQKLLPTDRMIIASEVWQDDYGEWVWIGIMNNNGIPSKDMFPIKTWKIELVNDEQNTKQNTSTMKDEPKRNLEIKPKFEPGDEVYIVFDNEIRHQKIHHVETLSCLEIKNDDVKEIVTHVFYLFNTSKECDKDAANLLSVDGISQDSGIIFRTLDEAVNFIRENCVHDYDENGNYIAKEVNNGD